MRLWRSLGLQLGRRTRALFVVNCEPSAAMCLDVDELLELEHREAMDLQVTKHVFWQPWITTDESNKQTSTKQLPTTKWKRERRRLPEYSRKSDPKVPENAPESPTSPTESSALAPLDMSVRQRGQPPSYTQAISSPGYRPSVITQAPTHSHAPHNLPSGISMCDPIIDEHFRRSLGKDYLMLFNNNATPEPAAPTARTVNVVDADSAAGLSVDDHFAKALGDTWRKLNQKDEAPASEKTSAVLSL